MVILVILVSLGSWIDRHTASKPVIEKDGVKIKKVSEAYMYLQICIPVEQLKNKLTAKQKPLLRFQR